ncbi:MAG TPA: UvrD-helicase domain-containing protein [Gammaproteobacteria bacterium]
MTDEAARREALDPRRSFIVQAPAGSGKTELLIQRYLTLLATVDEPEQVVAITFTRKAAAEMRRRVARALQEAACGASAAEPHRAATLRLAQRVLARSDEREWALAEHSRRMRIETLDALNARLARQLPTSSNGVAGARIVEDAAEHYRLAAARTVAELGDRGELGVALRRLLGYCEHSVARLETLLAELLPKREQWLRHFALHDEAALRHDLEAALGRLVSEALEAAAKALPPELEQALPPLLAHAARHAETAELRAAFAPWLGGVRADAAFDRLDSWHAAARLLLTKQNEWRRRLDRALGFGPAHPSERVRLRRLLDGLAANERARLALADARRLPRPQYSDEQWAALAALRIVLRRLAAELRVVFAERQAVDFVELALAAQQALAGADGPSDLLLALDYRVQHVLVDEFQDTSHSQLRLLELLTSGWEPGDGRTLFLVGDPMQSIYRFRDADMSLFLRVRRDGVGCVRCHPLTLERNFRSAPAVVDWVNETFARAFPDADDIGAGAARFSACRAVRAEAPDTCVRMHAMRTDDDEEELRAALEIVEREHRRAPEESLAVLVRSRTHLAGLHEHLRARGLAVSAPEIDPLHEHQVVQDLIGLTRALTHAGDRIAWLGVLHAPWCGIGWRDLEALCGAERDRTVWELLHDHAALARVGEDARVRLEWIKARFAEAFERRDASPFADWIERTWIALDGPACLDSEDDRERAQVFFATLARLSRRGDLDDPAALEEAFRTPLPYSSAPEGGIEIMTIHRAKGLEFDTVVLLGLGREPRRDEAKALYWMQRVANDGSEDLIIAPLNRPGAEDALTATIRRADDAREQAERTRLLYVAATRAKKRLHLVGRIAALADAPPERSLLVPLWPAVAERFGPKAEAPPASAEEPEAVQPVLRRLADGFDAGNGRTRADAEPPPPAAGRPRFEWAGLPAVQIGTVVHRWLHRVAAAGLDAFDAAAIRASTRTFRRELEVLGLESDEASAGADAVARALAFTLTDDRGRWILGPRAEARSELALTVRNGVFLEHVRLDRTFVEEGTRWIIDFKTGSHEGADVDAFLDAEVERWRAQLERYAAAIAEIDPRPITAGLYFPMLRAFRCWPAGGASR